MYLKLDKLMYNYDITLNTFTLKLVYGQKDAETNKNGQV